MKIFDSPPEPKTIDKFGDLSYGDVFMNNIGEGLFIKAIQGIGNQGNAIRLYTEGACIVRFNDNDLVTHLPNAYICKGMSGK